MTPDPLIHIRIPEPLLARLDHLAITLYGHARTRRASLISMVLALGLEQLAYRESRPEGGDLGGEKS